MSALHRTKRLKINGHSIDVRKSDTVDKKPVVILLHGIGVSSAYFLPFAELISKRFSVHVIDMPGYGTTPDPSHTLSIVELAEVVAHYIDSSGITDAIVIGQSMGSQVAGRLATIRPKNCRKIILIGPTINIKERTLMMQSFRLFQDTLREPLRLNLLIFRDYFRMGVLTYLQTSHHMMADHLEDYISEISVPVLIVRGQNDPIAPDDWVSFIAQKMPDATTAVVPQGPHNVHYVKPKELLALCHDFLTN